MCVEVVWQSEAECLRESECVVLQIVLRHLPSRVPALKSVLSIESVSLRVWLGFVIVFFFCSFVSVLAPLYSSYFG